MFNPEHPRPNLILGSHVLTGADWIQPSQQSEPRSGASRSCTLVLSRTAHVTGAAHLNRMGLKSLTRAGSGGPLCKAAAKMGVARAFVTWHSLFLETDGGAVIVEAYRQSDGAGERTGGNTQHNDDHR